MIHMPRRRVRLTLHGIGWTLLGWTLLTGITFWQDAHWPHAFNGWHTLGVVAIIFGVRVAGRASRRRNASRP